MRAKAYTDADWAHSKTERRSATGYYTMASVNFVSWKSKKQVIIAKSSTKDEYQAMAHGCCELSWLRVLLEELGFKHGWPMILHCDSDSAIKLAKNLVYNEGTEHVEVEWKFIKKKAGGKDKYKHIQVKLMKLQT